MRDLLTTIVSLSFAYFAIKHRFSFDKRDICGTVFWGNAFVIVFLLYLFSKDILGGI